MTNYYKEFRNKDCSNYDNLKEFSSDWEKFGKKRNFLKGKWFYEIKKQIISSLNNKNDLMIYSKKFSMLNQIVL